MDKFKRIVALILAVLIVLVFGSALLASRRQGRLKLGDRTLKIYICGTPLALYITCVVWVLCAALVLLLGATFSYYCLIAAIAYELIAACYYTVKLR